MSAVSGLNGNINRPDVPSSGISAGAADIDTPVSNKLYADMVSQIGPANASLVKLGMQFTALMSQPNLDPDTAAVILMDMIDKSGDADAKNSMQLMSAQFARSEKLNSARLKSFSDSLQKAAEAAAKKKDQQTMSDVGLGFQVAGAVFGLIGAILLTAFTAGLGAGAIVGAIIGLTTTVLDVGTRIAKATDAKYDDPRDPKNKQALDITIGGMVKMAIERAEANGHIYIPPELNAEQKKEYLSKVTMGVTITMNLLVAATTIAMGGLSIHQAGKAAAKIAQDGSSMGAKVAGSATQLFAKVASGAQIVSDVGGATTMITKGAYGINIAHITFEKNELDNQKTRMDVWQSILSNDMQSIQNAIANRIKDTSAMYEEMAALVSIHSQSRSNNISKI